MQELKKSDDARQTKLYQRFGNLPVPEDLVDFYQHLVRSSRERVRQRHSGHAATAWPGLSGSSEAVCTCREPV